MFCAPGREFLQSPRLLLASLPLGAIQSGLGLVSAVFLHFFNETRPCPWVGFALQLLAFVLKVFFFFQGFISSDSCCGVFLGSFPSKNPVVFEPK